MSEMQKRQVADSVPFEKIQVGDTAEIIHVITNEDIANFAKLTGDYNPLHVNEEYARKTLFRKPVVHGMLSASFISTLIGMKLPGQGALWTSQSLQFLKQAYVGDTLTIVSRVKQKSAAIRSLVLDIVITNQNDQKILTGESTVKILEIESEDEHVIMEQKKVVLITGGSKGIGAKIAQILAAEGYTVVINYSKSKEKAEELVNQITHDGGRALAMQADLAYFSEVETMFSTIEENVGTVSAVVHCAAAPNRLRPFSELSWDAIQEQIDIQLKGAYHCAKLSLPKMIDEKNGSLIIIGSIASDGVPPTQQTDYVMVKSALSAFARSLATEYGPKGVRVNIVAPGMTQTDRIAEYPDKAKMLTKMNTPLRQLAQPEDVAYMVSFLLSDKARHITGETLRVCGGAVML
jgi:3-oxoacyl-[acyl-carrier protein] reductase